MDNVAGQVTSLDALDRLAQISSDRSGTSTFQRYIWQAKQAARQWLTCFAESDPAQYIVCEHIEDLVIVHASRLRFIQLKTRDRGSWSAANMCTKGLDSLVRSYTAVRGAGLHESATFELWLEGPIADAAETVAFVEDPSAASSSIRAKIIQHGIKRVWLGDFLQRLSMRAGQPTREHIDAIAVWELSALWPALSRPDLESIYERLLATTTAAQADASAPPAVQILLASHDTRRFADMTSLDAIQRSPIRNQILSHDILTAITPPLPGEPIEKLISRIAAGEKASLLELKMTAAGARSETIRHAQESRAEMEIERQLFLASHGGADGELEHLAKRLLAMAKATATKVSLAGPTNPGVLARPGEAIAADLLSRPADLAHCDRHDVFHGDETLIYGFLGHLSDRCRFGWRA